MQECIVCCYWSMRVPRLVDLAGGGARVSSSTPISFFVLAIPFLNRRRGRRTNYNRASYRGISQAIHLKQQCQVATKFHSLYNFHQALFVGVVCD